MFVIESVFLCFELGMLCCSSEYPFFFNLLLELFWLKKFRLICNFLDNSQLWNFDVGIYIGGCNSVV